MLLIAVYHNLKKNEPYGADLYKKANGIPMEREITIEQALVYAQPTVIK